MGLTLGEAAKKAGVSKPTLSRAIKSGKVSATKQDDGSYSIEPAELFRAYPKAPSPAVSTTVSETPDETINNPPKASENNGLEQALQVKVEMLERLLEEQKRTSEVQLDAIKEVLEAERKVNALLTNQLKSSKPEQQKGFFKRLFS